MSVSIILSNSPNNVGVAYSFVSWLDNNDFSRPVIGLNIHHFNEGPNKSPKRPVIFMIHGGGWYVGDKNSFDEFKPKYFNNLGLIYVSVNYRLSRPYGNVVDPSLWVPDGSDDYASWDVNRIKHPTHIKDIANALKWTRDNIGNYGGDNDKIVVVGHSAGAHLALLLCTNTSYFSSLGISTSSIKACISLDTDTFNISDEIGNTETEMGASSAILSRNAFGVPYDSGRTFNDFSSVSEQNSQYDSGSPELYITSGIVTNFLLCTRGSLARINANRSFINSLSSVGIGTSLCAYVGTNTYSHEEIQSYIGNPDLIPPGKSLPTAGQIAQGAASVDISTFLTTYLNNIGII
jgi:predicted esterase